MKEIGINLNTLKISSIEHGIQIDFEWQYYGAAYPRQRRLIFITADITNPQTYPSILQKQLKAGIDIFYMKGAYLAPLSYSQFLPYIAQSIHPGGWLMTTDKTTRMDSVNPEPFLENQFTLHSNEEIELCKAIVQYPVPPFGKLSLLEVYPSTERAKRASNTGFTYWVILNLRQKIPMTPTSSTQAIQHT